MKSCKPHTSPPKQDPAAYGTSLGTPTHWVYTSLGRSCAPLPHSSCTRTEERGLRQLRTRFLIRPEPRAARRVVTMVWGPPSFNRGGGGLQGRTVSGIGRAPPCALAVH